MTSMNNNTSVNGGSLNDIEGSASLCTVCKFEMAIGKSDSTLSKFSSILTPSFINSEYFECNEIENLSQENSRSHNLFRLNDSNGHDIEEVKKISDELKNNDQYRNDNECKRTKIFDDDDENPIELSRSCLDLLECLDFAIDGQNIAQLSQNQSERGKVTVHSSSEQSLVYSDSDTISLEIGIAPKLSTNIIDRGKNVTDAIFTGFETIVGKGLGSDEHEQKPSEKPRETKTKFRSEKNSRSTLDCPAPNTHDSATEPTLKSCGNENSIELVTSIPHKKPRVIANQMVEIPFNIISLMKDKMIFTDVKNNQAEDIQKFIDTEDYQTTEILGPTKSIKKRNNERRELKTVDNENDHDCKKSQVTDHPKNKIRRVTNEDASTKENSAKKALVDAPMLEKIPKKKSSMNPYLCELQRQLVENSQRLIDQATEMRRLNSFISELRVNFSHEDPQMEICRKPKKKSKNELVSIGTQTTEPLAEVSKKAGLKFGSIINMEAPKPKAGTTKDSTYFLSRIDHSILDRGLVRSEKEKKETGEDPPVGNNRETIKAPKDLYLHPENDKNDKETTRQKNNETTPNDKTRNADNQGSPPRENFDPYYNPLRPRRWPRNRNNPKPLQGSHWNGRLRNVTPLSVIKTSKPHETT